MKRDTLLPRSALLALSLVGGLAACDKIKDAVSAATETGPATSYCESLCDWAVACAIEDRPDEDEAELNELCLDQTHVSDSACAGAENGSLSPDERVTLALCTNEVDATPNCDAIIGDWSELGPADLLDFLPPIECMTTDPEGATVTYNEARDAVMESGDALCDRVEAGFCGLIADCLVDKGVPSDNRGDVVEQCGSIMFGSITSGCKSSNKYKADLLDVNIDREMAKKCVSGLKDESACSIISTGFLASTTGGFCVASVAGIDDLVGSAGDLADAFGVSL